MTDERTDFTDLLRRRRAELGHSLRVMESRSVDPVTGEQAKFGWLSKVERGESVDPPKIERLRAIAAGYELPVRILQLAATQQFFDYDPASDPSTVWSEDLTTRIIAARAEEMSEEDRRQLAEIAETFARRRAQREGAAEDKSRE
ncbi:XRE family transcriptional regulator [Streptomyces sp. NPDC003299]